jgi:single-strand DNA-binding protein
MAKSVNKVILLGHVGKDPEIRSTTAGTLVANLSLATSERYKDREERTEWHNLVAFSRGAEILRDYVKKGSRLYVEGKIQTRSWDDKETGEKKYRTEVVVFDIALLTSQENGNSSNGNGRSRKQEAKGRGRGDENAAPDYGDVGITDNDIPF